MKHDPRLARQCEDEHARDDVMMAWHRAWETFSACLTWAALLMFGLIAAIAVARLAGAML